MMQPLVLQNVVQNNINAGIEVDHNTATIFKNQRFSLKKETNILPKKTKILPKKTKILLEKTKILPKKSKIFWHFSATVGTHHKKFFYDKLYHFSFSVHYC